MGCGQSLGANKQTTSHRTSKLKNKQSNNQDNALNDLCPVGLEEKGELGNQKINERFDPVLKIKDIIDVGNAEKSRENIFKLSRAAVEIQRVARGKSVRGSMSRRKSLASAESLFAQSLDPKLSPAENASKSLLDMAAVSHALWFTISCECTHAFDKSSV